MTADDLTVAGTGAPPVDLSIIIVTWNSFDYLCECLETVISTTVGMEREIIVVDNASRVDEAGAVMARFAGVRALRSEKNLGFAGANNWAFEHASGKYVLFLNPDTKVIGSAIAVMLGELKSVAEPGIMGCKLLNSDGSIQTSCIQRFPTILNQLLDIEFLRLQFPSWSIWGIAPLSAQTEHPVEVEVISGACLMIPRDVFKRAGKFNEQYFMYAEDVELCYQVQKLGRKVYYTGAATVVHHGGGASKWQSSKGWTAIMQRQAIMNFCRKTHGAAYAAAYRVAMACNAMGRLLLLSLLFPIRRLGIGSQRVQSSSSKWLSVLKWAIGLDRNVIGDLTH